MKTITTHELRSLEDKIYSKLMEHPDMGMGEMGECRDEASRIVGEWMQENNITEIN